MCRSIGLHVSLQSALFSHQMLKAKHEAGGREPAEFLQHCPWDGSHLHLHESRGSQKTSGVRRGTDRGKWSPRRRISHGKNWITLRTDLQRWSEIQRPKSSGYELWTKLYYKILSSSARNNSGGELHVCINWTQNYCGLLICYNWRKREMHS